MTVEIESSPIPPKGTYPWERLAESAEDDPQASFLWPYGDEEPWIVQRRLSGAGNSWCERNLPEYAVRTRKEDEGVRVWLVRSGS